MKVILQRVAHAHVQVDNTIIGKINHGVCLLVGIHELSTEKDASYLAKKIVHSRIFADEQGKMNLSLLDVKGHILSVSQFTLYANVSKGHPPSFAHAAKEIYAQHLYNYFNERLREYNIIVETGIFGSHMQVELVNDGPVTIVYEKLSKEVEK